MAAEPADVLIVGAGASGGVVALRLAEAGFRVVCLEQGDWHDRAEYRGAGARLGADHAQAVVDAAPTSAASRRTTRSTSRTPRSSPLMFSGVGGSMLHLRRRLAADAAVRLPGPQRSTASPTTGRSPTTSCGPTTSARDRQFGVSGLGGDPAYPPGGEDPPLPPLPMGKGGLKVARAHTRLGWHWWPETNSILSAPYDGRRPCVQRGHLPAGLQRGREGVDRPHPLAEGDRARRPADHRRPRPAARDERQRPRDRRHLARPRRRASTSSRRRSSCSPRTPSAPRGCCCCPATGAIPTASRTRPASSGSG